MDFLIVLGKLLLVFMLAGIFGMNRQRAHKPIGFGTFIFVSVGACALAIASLELSEGNPLPLLSAIVTGIGFLGAGAMIKTSDKIFGVTTAASIWLFAILGLLIGVGEYSTAMVMYFVVWIVVYINFLLQIKGIGTFQRKVIITTDLSTKEKFLNSVLNKSCKRYSLLELSIDKKENSAVRYYLVEGSLESIIDLPSDLEKDKGFTKCVIQ